MGIIDYCQMMNDKGYDSIRELLDGENLPEVVGYNFFIGHCQNWFNATDLEFTEEEKIEEKMKVEEKLGKNLEKLPRELLNKLSGIQTYSSYPDLKSVKEYEELKKEDFEEMVLEKGIFFVLKKYFTIEDIDAYGL